MAKPRKLASGRWMIQVYLGRTPEGKPINKTLTADTKKDVQKKAALFLASGNKPTRDTLRVALSEYITARAHVLSPATIRGYRVIERTIARECPALMDTRLHAITAEVLQSYINDLSLGHSPKTVRNHYTFITTVLKKKGIRVGECSLPQKTRTEIQVPSEEMASRVFSYIKGTDLEVPVILAAAGLRRGEICALRPEDFYGDVVHVSKDMVYDESGRWIVKPPKSFSSDRYVELPPGVGDIVRERGYVCRYNPARLTEAHGRMIHRLGVDHIRLHDWRHFMVSRLHDRGCSDEFIKRYGGWSSEHTMKSVYRHIQADRDRAMAEAAAESLAELLGS